MAIRIPVKLTCDNCQTERDGYSTTPVFDEPPFINPDQRPPISTWLWSSDQSAACTETCAKQLDEKQHRSFRRWLKCDFGVL